jgi:hypothetical protein
MENMENTSNSKWIEVLKVELFLGVFVGIDEFEIIEESVVIFVVVFDQLVNQIWKKNCRKTFF